MKQRYGYVCQSDVQQELAFYEERQGLQGPIVCEEQLGGGPQEQQRKQCVVHQLQVRSGGVGGRRQELTFNKERKF